MVKVMIIDDETSIVWLLEDLISELGYEPISALNGREALAKLSQLPEDELPALIITDLMMPQLDGVGLTRLLRADPRFRHIPILMMSAAEKFTPDSGADLFINKPFDLDALALMVEQIVESGVEGLRGECTH